MRSSILEDDIFDIWDFNIFSFCHLWVEIMCNGSLLQYLKSQTIDPTEFLKPSLSHFS